MNYLITGSSGFVGSNLRIYLENEGHKVYQCSRNLKENNKIYFDLEKKIHLKNDILNKIDVLIHCAYNFYSTSLEKNRKINVLGSEKIFIIGHSMGGSITLQLASFFPVDGIIIGATVLKFKRKFETYFLVPLFNKIQYKINKKKMFSKEHLLKNSFGYTEYPLVALNEFRKMNRGIIKNLHKVTCPTLIIHSNSDITSTTENVDLIYNSIASTDIKKVIVEDSSHHLFVDEKDQKIIYEEILNFLTKHTKQE